MPTPRLHPAPRPRRPGRISPASSLRGRTPLLAGLAVLAVAAPPARGQVRDRAALVAALDSAVRAHVDAATVPGVSVAVVRGSDTLLLRGYGQVDLEWDVPTPVDASASYEIGSITKQFTATAILQLVEAGKLDLDADVADYLDFDTHGHRIPLRRLLDHTSGIKGYTEMPVFGELMVRKLPRDSLVTLIEAEPLEFEPGTASIYNNSAYFLLGLILEKASGRPYADYVREHLFEPAGMTGSYYCSESGVRDGRAHGYDASPEGLVRAAYLDHTWPFAAGSLCSTARDLVRWNRALHGGRLLSPASYAALTTPRPLLDGSLTGYAMGLGVRERAGTREIAHGGGINGFLSDGRYYPEHDLVVVVLQNSAAAPPPGALGEALTTLVLGPEPERAAVAYRGDLDALTGEYAGPVRGRHLHVRVEREDGALAFWVGDADEPLRAPHVGDGVWGQGGTEVRFVVAGGRALELRLHQGAGYYVLRRVGG